METVKTRQRRGSRSLLALVLWALAALLLVGVRLWPTLQVYLDPYGALKSGAARLTPLPHPLRVGVLGVGERQGSGFHLSGTLELEAGEDGMSLALRDWTLGDESRSLTFSAWADAGCAALEAPDWLGAEGYYGVGLDTPILEQTRGTGGDPAYGWYFTQGQIASAQTAADLVRDALGDIHAPEVPARDREAVARCLEDLSWQGERTETGWLVSAQVPETAAARLADELGLPQTWVRGETALRCGLDDARVLRTVCLTGELGELELTLGDAPRAELRWREGSLTLALTVEEGEGLTRPAYTGAFTLLPYVPGAER